MARNGKHRIAESRTVFPVNGLAKEEGKEGRKRFLAMLEMTAWGMAIPCIIQRMCGKRRVSRIVIPSEAEGSFSLAVRRRAFEKEKWETLHRGKAGTVLSVNGLAKEAGKRGRKRFLAALEMTAWGMAIPCIIQRMCGKSTFPVSSSRAESRGLFRWRQDGERLTARNGNHRITGSGKGAFLVSSSEAKSRDLFRWR